MKQIKRRISELEKQTGKREPVTINIRKRIIGMDGEIESETIRAIEVCRES